MTEPASRHLVIIGGGLTGLAAAHRVVELRSKSPTPLQITLLEAGDRVGGVMGTKRVGEYLVETGADSFITNKPHAVQLCERLGIADQLISTSDEHRRSLVLHEGQSKPVPEGLQLLLPTQLRAVMRSPILSTQGKLRFLRERTIPPSPSDHDESLAEFVTRRFGKETLDRLIQPLVGGIYTADPERLSLAATLPRFQEMARQHGSLIEAAKAQKKSNTITRSQSGSGARYGLFATLKDGIGSLLDTLQQRIAPAVELRCNTRVNSVQQSSGGTGYQLQLDNGETISCDAVLLAVPAYVAGSILQHMSPSLAKQLTSIEYASSAIVVTGHALNDFTHPLDAFGLVIPAIEKRNVLAVSFGSRKFPDRAPSGHILLRTFLGGAMQPEVLNQSDDEIIAMVRDELEAIFGLSQKEEFAIVTRYNKAMPQYTLGHHQRVEQIEEEVNQVNGIELAGNAYNGVGIPDCIQSGEAAAERIMRCLDVT